jgi:hypothetical protein
LLVKHLEGKRRRIRRSRGLTGNELISPPTLQLIMFFNICGQDRVEHANAGDTR